MIFQILLTCFLTQQGIQAYKDPYELTKDVRTLIIGASIDSKVIYQRKVFDFYEKIWRSLVHASVFNKPHPIDLSIFNWFNVESRKFEEVIDIDDDLMFTDRLLNETMFVYSVFTLKLKSIMNYTMNYKYIVKSHYLPTREEYEFQQVFIERPDDVINSTWKAPEGEEDLKPIPEAQKFAEDFCEKLNFFDHLEEEEEFLGILETNPGYYYKLGEFKDFLKIFFYKYQISGKSTLRILTNDKTHVVFQCEIPLIFHRTENVAEFWRIDLEAIYHNSQWNFAKIFFSHDFESNRPVWERDVKGTAQLLRAEIISQLSGKIRRNYENLDEVGFEIEVFKNNSTYIKVCPALLAHPSRNPQYLAIKLPKFEGKMHFYTEIMSFYMVVYLYFPDDLGMKIRMSFDIGTIGDLEQYDTVKKVRISCAEISGPPEGEFEIIEREEDEEEEEKEAFLNVRRAEKEEGEENEDLLT